ncbi:MAG: right-handed parallel beta-helix repeat-containing protein [Polaribacter sp.]
MKIFFKSLLLCFIILNSVFNYAQTNYYFSNSGNDANTGTEANPFQTIIKLNSLSLKPGDKVFFKRGDIFIGQIVLQNESGADQSPIVFNSYGSGNLPVLSGSNGDNGTADPRSTVRIIGSEYLEFHNLRIENERFDTDGTAANDDKSYGIYFQSFLTLPSSGNFEDRALFDHFRFSNLHFENIYSVNTSNTEFNQLRSSGIHFFEAFVNDVIIEDCVFTNLERVGVWIRKYGSDIIIRNNKFIDIGGSGAIFSNTKRVLYENNLMRFCGSKSNSKMIGRGSGMWVFGSDDIVAQYNISQHSRGAGDSSGMHIDYANTNILYQYNYLEDSAGGFCETLGDNDNVIWRYNISVNEGTAEGGGKNKLLWVNAYAGTNRNINSKNVYIYNNTIYQGRDYKKTLGDTEIQFIADDISFVNNIIYLESGAKLGEKKYEFNVGTSNFKNNLFFGGTVKSLFKNLDATRVEVNPQLAIPKARHFSGYKIKSFSTVKGRAHNFTEPTFPLAGQGIFANVTSKATKDIFGNPVNLLSSTNIGADNGPGIDSETVNTFEAEAAVIDGGANEINCTNASGGKAVNFQVDGESLTFNNINVSETTTYLINVYYVNAEKSNLKVTVNNNASENVLLPATNGYCFQSGNPTSFSIVKQLNAGTNTLKFENGIIDKIEIVSIDNATLNTQNPILNDKKYLLYLENTLIRNNENLKIKYYNPNEFKKTKVSIYTTNGVLLVKQNFTENNIALQTNKLGIGVKIVVVESAGTVFVKKIIIY